MTEEKLVERSQIIAQSKEVAKDVMYSFHINEERKKILETKPSDWKTHEDNGFTIGLSQHDIGLLSDFEDPSVSAEDRKTLLQESKGEQVFGERIVQMYLDLVSRVSNVKVKKYFLARIDQVLSEDIGCAQLFNEAKNPYMPFLRILRVRTTSANREEEIMRMFACRILAKLFGALDKWYLMSLSEARRIATEVEQPLNEFIVILNTLARTKNSFIPLKALKDTLKLDLSHESFNRESGIRMLAQLMAPGINQEQVIYLAGFCTWMLTFNEKMLRMIDMSDAEEKSSQGLIKNMVASVKQVQREKVIRICFAAFRNMLNNEDLKARMVGLGLLDVIKTLNQTDDKELKENITKVGESLKTFLGHLSTFEKYTTEVMSGQLQRSAVHNEDFWRKNNAMFEHASYKHIRKLVELLDSKDPLTLEMACYDLGEFARFHPDGRVIVTRMGGKGKVMKLMVHRTEAIAKQALLCIQKLMVTNWEFLTKS